MKKGTKNFLPFGIATLLVFAGYDFYQYVLLLSLAMSWFLGVFIQIAMYAVVVTIGSAVGFAASADKKCLSTTRAFLSGALFASIITAVPLILPSPFPIQPSNYFWGVLAVSIVYSWAMQMAWGQPSNLPLKDDLRDAARPAAP